MDPEQTLSTRSVFDGKIVNVRVDQVGLPNGSRVIREVVQHQPAVVIAPMDEDRNVLLVRQYRYPVSESLLEAPAGGLEEGETPEVGAQRELREEVGYAAQSLDLLASFWTAPGYCTEFMYAFWAQGLYVDKLDPDEDEQIVVERVPLVEASDLIRSGEIRDAKTIAALLLLQTKL